MKRSRTEKERPAAGVPGETSPAGPVTRPARREEGAARDGTRSTWKGIRDGLRGEVLCGEERLDAPVDTVVASDAMSVVLAALSPGAALLTGLTNIQSVRTAHVADLAGVVYVRGCRPGEAAVHFARQKKLVLLVTKLGMFESCAILHGQGLRGVV